MPDANSKTVSGPGGQAHLDAYLDRIAADGAALVTAALQAPLDAPVPACAGWTVRDLVTHLGGVHRWAASVVGQALPDNDEVTGGQVGIGPDDAELLGWFRAGHESLLQTLRAAPSDLQCFSFLPSPTPLLFWARRQAHETAIHRVDVQSVHGAITPFEVSFARDGVEEMLFGFAARRRPAMRPGLMLLNPDDDASGWLVAFGADGVTASASGQGEREFDARVAGSMSDIYLWLWNRPSAAVVGGNVDVARQWRDVQVRWGG